MSAEGDIAIVRAALSALESYDAEIAAAGAERDTAALRQDRAGLAEILERVGVRGSVSAGDRAVLQRHARLTGARAVLPAELLPDSLHPFRDDRALPAPLRVKGWERWMQRFDAQTQARQDWCTEHGVDDPIDTALWIPDQPFDADDL